MEAVVEAVVAVDNLECTAAAAAVVDIPEVVAVDTDQDTDSSVVFLDIDTHNQLRGCSVARPCPQPSHWSSDSGLDRSNLVCPAVAAVAVARLQLLSAVDKLLAVVEHQVEGPCLVS